MGTLLTSFLGLPLRAPYKCKEVWNPVLERTHIRLVGWKGRYLSKEGKLILIKLVLSSLPTYFLSLLVIPSSIAYEIEKSQRNFLWD